MGMTSGNTFPRKRTRGKVEEEKERRKKRGGRDASALRHEVRYTGIWNRLLGRNEGGKKVCKLKTLLDWERGAVKGFIKKLSWGACMVRS